MPLFKENRDSLLLAHSEDLIDDEEFALLYDLSTSKKPDHPYWKYEPFNLESLSDSGCKNEFRFCRAYVYFRGRNFRGQKLSQFSLSLAFFVKVFPKAQSKFEIRESFFSRNYIKF